MNIYELSSEDKSKYRKEFNELSFTKKYNKTRTCWLIICWSCLFLLEILYGLAEDYPIMEQYGDGCFVILIITGVLYFIYTLFVNICFWRFLKIKHKINY